MALSSEYLAFELNNFNCKQTAIRNQQSVFSLGCSSYYRVKLEQTGEKYQQFV
ncbi:hypothetical protein [Okeania sp.]|uniref:hypothetical protein n=1 Tax=Okeania sp. TaxID=3100323 RepID=UPI002B4AE0D1|nr:hypothetical protein [Okeania sp.]